MKKFSCPSCGAEVLIQSTATIFTVCKYCKSTLVRKDTDLESIGKMADLKEDASPLQIGTSGKYRAAGLVASDFLVIGRVRVSWEDGFWNEWFVRFDDGLGGWLAEAQGDYMLSFEVTSPVTVPKLTDLEPESEVTIGKIKYLVSDIKTVTYTFAEGELPFIAPQGFKGQSVDLEAGENDFASISYSQEGNDVFVGHYIEFDDFHFQNLRAIDGW